MTMTAPPLELSTTELIASARQNDQTGFLTELDVRWITETHEWELLEDLIWIGSKGDVIIVPGRSSSGHGFRTDFASTPRLLFPLFPPTGAWTKAAVIHDFLCRGLNDYYEAEQLWWDGAKNVGAVQWHRQVGPRPERPPFDAVDTDAIFKKIMLDEGTSEVAAQVGWVGVRCGAAANPARREGWFRTFWEFAITLAFWLGLALVVGGVIVWL